MDYRAEIKLIGLPIHRKALLSRAKMRLLLALPIPIKRALFHGRAHYCPVCHSSVRKFEDFGYDPKTWCPVCASMSRHRLLWLFFQQRTNLFDGSPKKMLHIAPEVAFEPRFEQIANLDYLTADLQEPRSPAEKYRIVAVHGMIAHKRPYAELQVAGRPTVGHRTSSVADSPPTSNLPGGVFGQASSCMVKMDITNIQYPNNTFDVVCCNHVFEHIPDDRKAMREFVRVLKPEGWAVFMVPIIVEQTIEDPSVVSPAERERRFGQHDHVRSYGPDFKERLEEEGFDVSVTRTEHIALMNVLAQDASNRSNIFLGRELMLLNIAICRC